MFTIASCIPNYQIMDTLMNKGYSETEIDGDFYE